jgi:hypothetical protein
MSGSVINSLVNFLPGAATLAGTGAIGAEVLQTGILYLKRPRYIGAIIPDVAIEEQQSDRVAVTQHPVALGAPISDHAYRLPASVTMRAGWSNSTPGVAGTWGYPRIDAIYRRLLELQGNLQPFTLTTGKRTYRNMMLTELSVRTDRTTEQALIVEAHFQEVIRVSTEATTQPAQQSQPQTTQETQSTTQQQATPAPRVSVMGQMAPGSVIPGKPPRNLGAAP